MTTALTVIDPNNYSILDPANNAAELVAANLGGESVSEFDLDQVRVPAGGGTTWTIPSLSGDEDTKEIEGIIVHIGKRRQFWASDNPTGEPPDCHSRNMIDGIGTPGGLCEKCPNNEFGSSKNERGKACKESRAVFLIRKEDNLPIVVNVPPGSLKNLKQYVLRLKVPYFAAITKLTLGKVQNKDGIAYSEVRPAQSAVLPAEAIGRMREYASQLQKTFG